MPSVVRHGSRVGFWKAIPTIETGYDNAALKSYETFKKVQSDGVIPAGVRFQVSLPTPNNVAAFLVLNFILTFVFSPQYAVELYGTKHEIFAIAGNYVVTWEQSAISVTPPHLGLKEPRGASVRGLVALASLG